MGWNTSSVFLCEIPDCQSPIRAGWTRRGSSGALAHSSPWKNKLSYHETPVAPPPPLHISPPSLRLFFFSLSPSPTFIRCSFLWLFLFSYISPFSLICVSLCVFVYHVAPFRWQKKQRGDRPDIVLSPQCILLLVFSSGESRLQVITPPKTLSFCLCPFVFWWVGLSPGLHKNY